MRVTPMDEVYGSGIKAVGEEALRVVGGGATIMYEPLCILAESAVPRG